MVLRGGSDTWEAGPRSAAEFMEAAAHYEQAAALRNAPTVKAQLARMAILSRIQAAAM